MKRETAVGVEKRPVYLYLTGIQETFPEWNSEKKLMCPTHKRHTKQEKKRFSETWVKADKVTRRTHLGEDTYNNSKYNNPRVGFFLPCFWNTMSWMRVTILIVRAKLMCVQSYARFDRALQLSSRKKSMICPKCRNMLPKQEDSHLVPACPNPKKTGARAVSKN
jgi:hypothetical protein